MFRESLLALVMIQAPAGSGGSGNELYDLQHSAMPMKGDRPSVEPNDVRADQEDITLLSTLGLPTIGRYRTPILRYHESSPLHKDGSKRELFVQFALSADGRRMQVLVVHAVRRSRAQVDIADRRLALVAPETFASLVTAVVDASSDLPGYDPTYIPACSHNPQAAFYAHVPGELSLVRRGRCQGPSNAAVRAGSLLIGAAQNFLDREVTRPAKF